jgi:hypothetical protein
MHLSLDGVLSATRIAARRAARAAVPNISSSDIARPGKAAGKR